MNYSEYKSKFFVCFICYVIYFICYLFCSLSSFYNEICSVISVMILYNIKKYLTLLKFNLYIDITLAL